MLAAVSCAYTLQLALGCHPRITHLVGHPPARPAACSDLLALLPLDGLPERERFAAVRILHKVRHHSKKELGQDLTHWSQACNMHACTHERTIV